MNRSSTSEEIKRSAEPLVELAAAIDATVSAMASLVASAERVQIAFRECTKAYSPQNPLHPAIGELGRVLAKMRVRPPQQQQQVPPPSLPTFEQFINTDCLEPLHRAAADIRSAATAKAEYAIAAQAYEEDQQTLERKAAKYAAKGQPPEASSEFLDRKRSIVQTKAGVSSAETNFDARINAALRSKESALMRALEGYSEHLAGIGGIVSQAMSSVFAAAPRYAEVVRVRSPRSRSPTATNPSSARALSAQRSSADLAASSTAAVTSSPPRNYVARSSTGIHSPASAASLGTRYHANDSSFRSDGGAAAPADQPMPSFMRHPPTSLAQR